MQDLREELSTMVDEAEWEWLMPHAERDALLVVDQNLDLLEVGMAIASDNVSSVQTWISQNLIHKPSAQETQIWESDRRFKALIIQPYVLVQDLDSPA